VRQPSSSLLVVRGNAWAGQCTGGAAMSEPKFRWNTFGRPEMGSVWVVRAGRGGKWAEECRKNGVCAIGWRDAGDFTGMARREDFKKRIEETYPTWKPGRRLNSASQLYRFVNEIRTGDLVATPISATREILLGRVEGPYRYEPDLIPENPNVRPVDWMRTISRDDLSVRARNSAGSTLTVFLLDEHLKEFTTLAEGKVSPHPETEEEEEEAAIAFVEEVEGRADEMISDRLAHMDPLDFVHLVAGLLRSIGYHTRVGPEGPDQGVDIVAYPDPLGFEAPRIKVQVKHRRDRSTGPDVRNFLATLRGDDRGLFVSTGGFTKDATFEASRTSDHIHCTLLDRDEFVELLTDRYEDLDAEGRRLLPLKKVYIPIE